MVAAHEEDALLEHDLEREQQADDFEGVLAAVDIVAEEEVVDDVDVAGLAARRAELVEEPHQVDKLAVDVAKALDRRRQLEEGRLALEHILRRVAECDDLVGVKDEGVVGRGCPRARPQQQVHDLAVDAALRWLPRESEVVDALALLRQPVDRDGARELILPADLGTARDHGRASLVLALALAEHLSQIQLRRCRPHPRGRRPSSGGRVDGSAATVLIARRCVVVVVVVVVVIILYTIVAPLPVARRLVLRGWSECIGILLSGGEECIGILLSGG